MLGRRLGFENKGHHTNKILVTTYNWSVQVCRWIMGVTGYGYLMTTNNHETGRLLLGIFRSPYAFYRLSVYECCLGVIEITKE